MSVNVTNLGKRSKYINWEMSPILDLFILAFIEDGD